MLIDGMMPDTTSTSSNASADEKTGQAERSPRRKRWRRRLLAVVISIIIGLLIAEAALWIFPIGPTFNIVFMESLRPSDNPKLEYELRPGAPDGPDVISSAGLRDREFTRDKPAGVFRIAVLGDSVTYGVSVPRSQSYPKQLEALLNQYSANPRHRFEVMNFGVSGYNAVQNVETLRTRVIDYHPDLVIWGYVLNEPQTYSLDLEGMKVVHNAIETTGRAPLSHRVVGAMSHSKVFSLMRLVPVCLREPAYAAHIKGLGADYLGSLHEGDSWQKLRQHFADIAAMTRAPRKVPVLIAIFPTSDGDAETGYPMTGLHNRIIAEARSHGLHALDLAPAFFHLYHKLDEDIYIDFIHPNARGYELAAIVIARDLAASGHLPNDTLDLEVLLRDADPQLLQAAEAS